MSYSPTEDQLESLVYIHITLPCKLSSVQKGPLKWQDPALEQRWAPAASITFKGFWETPHARVQFAV